MSETYEERQQEKRERMRLGAWIWWDKGDIGNAKNKRNGAIAMARYYGHTYAAIAKGSGLTRERVRQITERAARQGWKPKLDLEAAGSCIAKGEYEWAKRYLTTEDFKKLITYCEALKGQ